MFILQENRTRRRIHVDEEIAFKSYNTQSKMEETESERRRVLTGHKLRASTRKVALVIIRIGLPKLRYCVQHYSHFTGE